MASKNVERLRRLYVEERMSPKDIADKFGVHFSTIYRRLERHGIERKSRVQFNTVGSGYEELYTPEGERVYVHRLLAVAEHGFDAIEGKVIHHKSGVTWDNRPSNVEPIDHADHTSLHKQDEEFDRNDEGKFA